MQCISSSESNDVILGKIELVSGFHKGASQRGKKFIQVNQKIIFSFYLH